jgi:hypothetical protein
MILRSATNVYSNNTKAVKLYKKLGFKPKSVPSDSTADEEIDHMILKPDNAAIGRNKHY